MIRLYPVSRALTFTVVCVAVAGIGSAQVSIYRGGDGMTTPLRGREICGTSTANLNAIDATNYVVSTAAEGAFKALTLRGSVPNPMGRDTTAATAPVFGVSLSNPTAADITVTEIRIQSTNRLFLSVVGVRPLTGWTRPANTQLRWTGSVTLPASSAIDFICRGQADSQNRPNEPITLTAVTSSGTLNLTGLFTTTETNTNLNPAVSLYYIEGAAPAYVAASSNFGQGQSGQTKSFTVRIEESEQGNTQAIPAGAQLRINIPPGWSSVAVGPSVDFNVAPVTAPSACTPGMILATLLNPVLNRTVDLTFVARAPNGLRSVSLLPFDTTLTSTTPAFTLTTQFVVEVLPTIASGTRNGLSAEDALTVVPQPMGRKNLSMFGAAYANTTANTQTVTQVRIRRTGATANLFREVFGVAPATGWSLISGSEVQWNGSVAVAAYSGADFLANLQGNDLMQTGPSPIETTVMTSAGSFINSDGLTWQTNGISPSLYYLRFDEPAAYLPATPNGLPTRFTIAVEEREGGSIRAGSIVRVTIPARWTGVAAASSQPGFGTPVIVAPTMTVDGSVAAQTTVDIRRGRLLFSFEASAPANVLQSLFRFETTLIDATSGLSSTTQALVQTIELNDGGMIVRHQSPTFTDTVMRQFEIDLRATSAPSKPYLMQILNQNTTVWESIAYLGLDATLSRIVGAVRTNLPTYLDIQSQIQTRVLSTGRECHLLSEDFLQFIVDKFDVRGTSLAPISTAAAATMVPMETLRFTVDESLVDVTAIVVQGLGNAPLADIAAVRLIHDIDCDSVAQPGDPVLGQGPLGAMGTITFGGGATPLFSASAGADACVILTADVAAAATAGNLIALGIDSGTSIATSAGTLPTPSATGYPIRSGYTVVIGSDTDLDGLSDAEEAATCTLGMDADSDDDGLRDGEELLLGTDPCVPDTDGDGLMDGLESGILPFADLTDTDMDGTPDVADPAPTDMAISGTNAAFFTPDQDPTARTNPLDNDSDDDGLSDGEEDTNLNGSVENMVGDGTTTGTGETDPRNLDTDGDACYDGTESAVFIPLSGTNIAIFRPDVDPGTMTNPVDSDTDDDGFTDGSEDSDCNGRVDPGETDPNRRPGPDILRNDEVTMLTPISPALSTIFVGTGANSLDPLGPTMTPIAGEGADPTLNGSDDFDDLYAQSVISPYSDADVAVLTDTRRRLVFYQVAGAPGPLWVVKNAGAVELSW